MPEDIHITHEDMGEDIVGNRPLQKRQCLTMNWGNPKDITVKEIAYCIYTYNLNTNQVPNNRLNAVTKELEKLQKQEKKEHERKLIEDELAVYKYIGTEKIGGDNGIDVGKFSNEIINYQLDPDLFETHSEAMAALSKLASCWNYEMNKSEVLNHKYKNPTTHSKELKRMKEAMERVKQKYIKLGGSAKAFDQGRDQIPMPKLGTLKQDVDAHREHITNNFVSMGVSTTRAKKIAIAITLQIYSALQ